MTSNKGLLLNADGVTVVEGICWEFEANVNFNQTYLTNNLGEWNETIEIPGRTDVSFNASILTRPNERIELPTLFDERMHLVIQQPESVTVFYEALVTSYQFSQMIGDFDFFEIKFSGIVSGMHDYVGYPLNGGTFPQFIEWLKSEHLPTRSVRARRPVRAQTSPIVDWIHEGF